MRIKVGNNIAYKNPRVAILYGVGIVESITDKEYTILWALRGPKKYRRSILDQRLDDVFRQGESGEDLPRERLVKLGAAKTAISLNENYDRAKVSSLCKALKKSKAQRAKNVADGLTGEMFTNRVTLRPATKEVLRQLALLCGSKDPDGVSEAARKISQELFFGYVIQNSDFTQK
jgi:hypothetical protein